MIFNQVPQRSVSVSEGNLVTLHIIVDGNPMPDVYWKKGKRDILNIGKYRILDNGSLQVRKKFTWQLFKLTFIMILPLKVIGAEISDEGSYTCIADNGRGVPPTAQVTQFT